MSVKRTWLAFTLLGAGVFDIGVLHTVLVPSYLAQREGAGALVDTPKAGVDLPAQVAVNEPAQVEPALDDHPIAPSENPGGRPQPAAPNPGQGKDSTPKAPEPADQAVPKPEPEHKLPQAFSVFFPNPGMRTLASEEKAILKQAAAAIAKGQARRIEIVGRTDSSGRYSSNLRLARARALSVKKALLSLGVRRSKMTIRAQVPPRSAPKVPDKTLRRVDLNLKK